MPSFQDFLVMLNAMHLGYMVANKYGWIPKIQELRKALPMSQPKSTDRYTKASVLPPKPFSGHIKDWAAWKKSTRATFGLMGLLDVIDDSSFDVRDFVVL